MQQLIARVNLVQHLMNNVNAVAFDKIQFGAKRMVVFIYSFSFHPLKSKHLVVCFSLLILWFVWFNPVHPVCCLLYV